MVFEQKEFLPSEFPILPKDIEYYALKYEDLEHQNLGFFLKLIQQEYCLIEVFLFREFEATWIFFLIQAFFLTNLDLFED